MPCPGQYHDRRQTTRSDRRQQPRVGPCRHKWGRVGPGTVCQVRVKRGAHLWGVDIQPGCQLLILECPDCHQPIEFLTSAADRAA